MSDATASESEEERASRDDADSDDGVASSDDGVASSDDGPKRKRKRRRRRKSKAGEDEGSVGAASTNPAAPAEDAVAAMANLAGLFSHLDDRQIPCRVDGCRRTWVWSADEQIRSFGQPPPRRMCNEHASQLDAVTDLPIACANPGCDKTWTWPKGARLAQVQRGGVDKPPKRVCDECLAEEKSLQDREAPCKVEGCVRTWTWDADSQLKHRTWLRRSADEPEEMERGPGGGRKRGRRRKRGRGSIHDAPQRMCELCRAKLAKIDEREGPCKVHGCTRMAKVDRDTQLRAWAALHTEDLDAEVTSLPRRMCDVCREFCKNHPDRPVPCGRGGCDKSWQFKTGAQLQAFLAGRLEDPMRLCDECSKGDFILMERPIGAPDGAEVMPCVVLGCDGVWYWLPGTHLGPANLGSTPTDRMCADHRKRTHAPTVDVSTATVASVEPIVETTTPGGDDFAPEAVEPDAAIPTDSTTSSSTDAAPVVADASSDVDTPA